LKDGFQLLRASSDVPPVVSQPDSWNTHTITPFGTPHAPIFIDDNSDFANQSWPGEGTVEQPYVIAGLMINGSTVAINITNTNVHFFIKDCWLNGTSVNVIELNSVSHARISNNTILSGERGVTAFHCDDITIIDNLFYSFSWAGVYMEDCSFSTLENNNCTTCFVGLHIEQSNDIWIEDNYCTGCLGGIEIYLQSEYITVYNNTLIDNDVGIGLYADCSNNLITSNNCTLNNVYGIFAQFCQDNDIVNNFCRVNIGDVVLENCTSHTVRNNNFGATTGAGPDMVASIALYDTNGSIVTDNYVENSFICIEMKWSSSFNQILNNTCFFYAGGVVAWYNAPYNTITNNTCNGNGAGEVDIFIEEAPHTTVTKNRCSNSMYNIASFDSNHSTIVDNECELSWDGGIVVLMSDHALVNGNTLLNGSTGIVFDDVFNASIRYNYVSNFTATWTGGPTGIHLENTFNSSVQDNNITKCNVAIYLTNCMFCNITENICIKNFDGIVLVNTNYRVLVDGNYCHLQEGYALVVVESFECVISRNICTNTSGAEGFCLLFGDCYANASENSFSFSTGGIEVNGNNGLITGNTIEENEQYGITIDGIIGPNVTWNIFEDNGVNAVDNSDTAMFDYNFWSNYTGVDSNADGIGNTWHPIQGTRNNNDTHPLVYHPTLPSWDPPDDFDLISELGHEFEWAFGYAGLTIYAPIVGWRVNDINHFTIDDEGTIRNAVFLNLGEYQLEVTAINIYGFELVGFYTLTVSDTVDPGILGPDDFDYVVGQVGRTITWIAEDYDPASYVVTLDGVQVISGAWNSTAENVTITADGLSIGDHTFVVTFFDGSGNSATDTVVVTVRPAGITTLLLAAGAGGAVIMVIIVIYLARKKKPVE
jgi:parallel beta-helix repeat protein